MEYFWAVSFTLVLGLFVYGIISSKRKQRRIRKDTEALLPRLRDHISANRRYDVTLNSGAVFKNVRFLGLSVAHSEQGHVYLPFPLSEWLVLERENGKKVYLKPTAIRYYEDSEIA